MAQQSGRPRTDQRLRNPGVENRGAYYDRAGATRDMLQNHLLQLLCLVAMEPPAQFEAEAVRDER